MSHYICNHLSLSGRLLFSLRLEQVGLAHSTHLNEMREPAAGARTCPRQMPTAVQRRVLPLVGWRRLELLLGSLLRNLQANLQLHLLTEQKEGNRIKNPHPGTSSPQRTVLHQEIALPPRLLRSGTFCGTRNSMFLPPLAMRGW